MRERERESSPQKRSRVTGGGKTPYPGHRIFAERLSSIFPRKLREIQDTREIKGLKEVLLSVEHSRPEFLSLIHI